MEMKKLSDEEAGTVTGGAYTAEAQAWLDRNWSTISERTTPQQRQVFRSCMNICCYSVIDLPQLKDILSEFANVDDLT